MAMKSRFPSNEENPRGRYLEPSLFLSLSLFASLFFISCACALQFFVSES